MCLAVPGQIISIDDSNPEMKMAAVRFGEAIRDISIQWLPDIAVGDYIQFKCAINGEIISNKLATNAVPMGKVAAKNIIGEERPYKEFVYAQNNRF